MKQFKPYYAVIFTSTLHENISTEYNEVAIKMLELAKEQTGFLGAESARNEIGITVSYWQTLQDIQNWKQNIEHKIAQQMGKEKFYKSYKTRVCKVEYEYSKSDL